MNFVKCNSNFVQGDSERVAEKDILLVAKDAIISRLREEIAAARDEVIENRRIVEAAVEKRVEMEKMKVCLWSFACSAFSDILV